MKLRLDPVTAVVILIVLAMLSAGTADAILTGNHARQQLCDGSPECSPHHAPEKLMP